MSGSRPILSILRHSAAAAVLALLWVVPGTRAGVIVHQLGQQDFTAGAGPLTIEHVQSAGAGEPFPFDGSVFGDDRDPHGFGKITFSYAFAPPPAPLDGTLTLGLIGLDSTPGSRATVRLLLDGVEQPNSAFAGMSAPFSRSSASVVSVPVPAALLSDGQLSVTVKAYRPGRGFPGNAIEADFSTLAIRYQPLPSDGGDNGGGSASDGGDGSGSDNGANPPPINGSGGDGNGNGNGHPTPPATVPLPPAAFSGLAGLFIAAAGRLRIKRRG